MEILQWINRILGVLFFLCYAYQFFYLPIPHLKKDKPHGPAKAHRYAVLICARNEEAVIADLLESLRRQTYDMGLVSVFVMADNCTDRTAQAAREAGAMVYERFDTERVGKGYALQALLEHIRTDCPEGFDGYFVFDADNVLKRDYIEQMNRTFSDGYEIITSYRNSKNYGSNWISAGYGLWFLRESEYLNHARMLLHTSCAVSGTGFLFSDRVLREQGGWPFHLLIEDIEFSVWHILKGYRIGYCHDAMLYDEQPMTFRQSWRQRLRWSRGYLQVLRRYGGKMLVGMARGSFSCYDMSMNILPAFALSLLGAVCNTAAVIVTLACGGSVWAALLPVLRALGSMYLTLFALGGITTLTQWRNIPAGTWKKLRYTLTFPLFMFTYIPISIAALFVDCGWKPITHSVRADALPAELLKPQ